MRDLYTSILLYMCLVFAGTSFAQSSCDQQITVNVRDSRGEFVSDLQASSFDAKVGGHEAFVTSANVFTGPTRLILVLDASGSMGSMGGQSDTRRWTATKSFAEHIVATVPASTGIAIVAFNTQIVRKTEFGHSRKELMATIEQLPNAKERTALWNSLLEASKMFGDPAPGDAMLVLSDFGDNLSKAKPAEVQTAFMSKGIRLFGVRILDPSAQSMEEVNGIYDFLNVTKQTGGDVIKELGKYRYDEAGLLKLLSNEIGAVYVVKITAPVALQKPERLNLSLIADVGKKNKGISLYYPQKGYPCVP